MKKALFFWGGYAPHEPEKTAHLFADAVRAHGLEADVVPSLDVLDDAARLREYALISPCWTMGTLTGPQTRNLSDAVRAGVGLGGLHGGMGDAFRGNTAYEWMVGGHFVGHPHVGDYTVRVRDGEHPVTCGLPGSFAYSSEQYYLLTDPGNHVLADTEYLHEGRSVTMPVAWLRRWGQGRVFYSSLGHVPAEFETFPEARTLTVRGLLWAAGALS